MDGTFDALVQQNILYEIEREAFEYSKQLAKWLPTRDIVLQRANSRTHFHKEGHTSQKKGFECNDAVQVQYSPSLVVFRNSSARFTLMEFQENIC